MDPVRQLAQLGDRQPQLGRRVVEERDGLPGRQLRPLAYELEANRQPHEALLRPVVQVALDPPALGTAGPDQPGTRRPSAVRERAGARPPRRPARASTGPRRRGTAAWLRMLLVTDSDVKGPSRCIVFQTRTRRRRSRREPRAALTEPSAAQISAQNTR